MNTICSVRAQSLDSRLYNRTTHTLTRCIKSCVCVCEEDQKPTIQPHTHGVSTHVCACLGAHARHWSREESFFVYIYMLLQMDFASTRMETTRPRSTPTCRSRDVPTPSVQRHICVRKWNVRASDLSAGIALQNAFHFRWIYEIIYSCNGCRENCRFSMTTLLYDFHSTCDVRKWVYVSEYYT